MGEDAEYDKQIERAETGEEPVFNIGKDKVNTDEKNENIDGLNQDVKSGELVEPKRDDYPNTRSGAKIYQDAKKSFDEASKQISETSTKISETNKDISEKPGKPIKNKRGRIIGYEKVDESIKNVTFDDFNEEIDDIDSKTSNTLKKYNNITKKEELSNLILDEKKSESKNKFEDIFEMSSDISDSAGEVSILNIEGTTKNELTPNIDTGTTNASKNIDFDPEKSGQERFESSIALGVF
jgi:hypothetical protein